MATRRPFLCAGAFPLRSQRRSSIPRRLWHVRAQGGSHRCSLLMAAGTPHGFLPADPLFLLLCHLPAPRPHTIRPQECRWLRVHGVDCLSFALVLSLLASSGAPAFHAGHGNVRAQGGSHRCSLLMVAGVPHGLPPADPLFLLLFHLPAPRLHSAPAV
ncbi:MAG: hypothetical protein J3K34DRAFT_420056 [Monoraphidium minutum]|nr:MAG: hypothetical protein J3K34DRAFT_420056 [Monoraphidium minutum]